jgi:putative transposase
MRKQSSWSSASRIVGRLLVDALTSLSLGLRSRSRLAAENLFLRKQLALYTERRVRARADDASRITGPAGMVDRLESGAHHREARHADPVASQRIPLVLAMEIQGAWPAADPSGSSMLDCRDGSSERHVGRRADRRRIAAQARHPGLATDGAAVHAQDGAPGRWVVSTVEHLCAQLCRRRARVRLLVAVTAMFRTLYVFVVLEVGSRRIIHWNVTEHPTAAWTIQQFRASVPGDQLQRFLIHDRDSIYASAVDDAVTAMGLTVLKTPVRCPQANAFCERLIGTIRRECLDWLILLNERHLRAVVQEWVAHYNRGRPHAQPGPGIPGPPRDWLAPSTRGHQIPTGHRVVAEPVLGGLHHEYRVEPIAA